MNKEGIQNTSIEAEIMVVNKITIPSVEIITHNIAISIRINNSKQIFATCSTRRSNFLKTDSIVGID